MSPASRLRPCGAPLGAAWAVLVAVAGAEATTLQAAIREPRAFGYQVGDVVQRVITIEVPDGLRLDEASLPRPGARGSALELRAQRRTLARAAGGQREEITLDYQVFLAPPAVRLLELPAFTLRYEGQPRAQDLRIEAWPVAVAPLVPVDVSPRRGLGELQPEHAPPLIDTLAARWRLAACAAVMALLLAYLALVYLAWPWRLARRRPFALAWRQLRQLGTAPTEPAWRDACRQLHAALNRHAGEVVFEAGVDRFTSRRAAFAPLREDILHFLRLSQREFFAASPREAGAAAWLLGFARRCRDAERGS
jgi:mxaA protein